MKTATGCASTSTSTSTRWQIFRGDAMGLPVAGTLRGIPPIPMDYPYGLPYSAIDPGEIQFDFSDDTAFT
jgi:hypothetical protein